MKCAICGEDKPKAVFQHYKIKKECKRCFKKKTRDYQYVKTFRQIVGGKERRIIRSEEEIRKVERLLKKNKCGVCGKPEPRKDRRLSIDHCHKTGRVRGVLCSTCNRALGLLKDSPNILTKLLNYLLENT